MLPANHPELLRRALDAAMIAHSDLLRTARDIEVKVESRMHVGAGDVAARLGALADSVSAERRRGVPKSLLERFIPKHFADLADEVREFDDERLRLANELRSLAERMTPGADVGLSSGLGVDIRATIAAVRRHEAAEARLLRRALAESSRALSEPYRHDLEVDHRFLRQLLAWLDGARDGLAIADLLRDLGDYLEVHFAAEERPDGLFSALAQRASAGAAALREEHGRLLEHVSKLRKVVRPTLEPAPAEQLERVRALCAALRAHEAAEESALQDLLERDLGTAD